MPHSGACREGTKGHGGEFISREFIRRAQDCNSGKIVWNVHCAGELAGHPYRFRRVHWIMGENDVLENLKLLTAVYRFVSSGNAHILW